MHQRSLDHFIVSLTSTCNLTVVTKLRFQSLRTQRIFSSINIQLVAS